MYAWIKKELKWAYENKVYLLLISVLVLLFSFSYVNRFTPYTIGWQYYNILLMKAGKVVYKDFYNYIPPGNVLRAAWVYWLANGNFLGVRIIYIFERLFLAILMFKILSRFFDRRKVWLAIVTGVSLLVTTNLDQFGDYNQTYRVYLLLGVCFGIKFFDSIGNKKQEIISILLFGISLGMLTLFKQSAGLLAAMFFFLYLIVYCLVEKNKRFWVYTIYAVLGFLLPVGICALWLLKNGALTTFIEQLFASTSAKGDVSSIFLRLWRNAFKPDCLVIFFPCLVLYYLKRWEDSVEPTVLRKFNHNVCVVIYVLELLFVFQKYGQNVGQILSALKSTDTYWVFLFLVVFCAFTYRYKTKSSVLAGKEDNGQSREIVVACGLSLALYFVTCISGDTLKALYNNSNFASFVQDIPAFAVYIICFQLILLICYYILKRKHLYTPAYTLTVIALFLSAYEGCMSTGTKNVTCIVASTCIPFSLCVLYDIEVKNNKLKNVVITGVCMFLCVMSLAQKFGVPYSWWDWTDPPITSETNYSIDVDRMEGYRVSKNTKIIYEEVTRLIEENSEEDDFVLAFPHMKVFNILANRINAPTKVVSYYFDVCPDEYAIQDAEIIRVNPPKIVLMYEYDDQFWSYNENAFRGGNPSGQREILNWFNEVKEDSYIQIGKIGKLEIYRIDDGSKINYTYFDSDDHSKDVIEQVDDQEFSIANVVLESLNVNMACRDHALKVICCILLFVVAVLLIAIKCNHYILALLLVSAIGVLFTVSPVFSLIYVPIMLLYYECGKKLKFLPDRIIFICMLLSIISFPICYYSTSEVLKSFRVVLQIIIFACAFVDVLQVAICNCSVNRACVKYVIATIVCCGLFLASQVYFSETPWWDVLPNNSYFSNQNSLQIFGVLCLGMWGSLIFVLKYIDNMRQKGKV